MFLVFKICTVNFPPRKLTGPIPCHYQVRLHVRGTNQIIPVIVRVDVAMGAKRGSAGANVVEPARSSKTLTSVSISPGANFGVILTRGATTMLATNIPIVST